MESSLLESVRKRPGMYVGDTGERGAGVLANELVANTIDQFLAGRATRAAITLEGDRLEVSDDGEGLPFDTFSALSPSLATQYLTRHHDTATADGHTPHAHLSSFGGQGLAIVNALCVEFSVTSWRSEGRWRQSFDRGRPVSDPQLDRGESGRGTIIRLRLDPDIFKGAVPHPGSLRAVVVQAVHLFGGFQISLNRETFVAPNGLADLVWLQLRENVNARCGFHVRATVDDVLVEVAAYPGFPSMKSSPRLISWANGAPTSGGGSHEAGLRDVLGGVRWRPELAYVHVLMSNPQFAGPTKNRLDAPPVRVAVQRAVEFPLMKFCAKHDLGIYAR